MKTGIVFLIQCIIIFIILLCWFQLFPNNNNHMILKLLGLSTLIAGIILLLHLFTSVKEGFHFKVSDAKQNCMNQKVSTDSSNNSGCCGKDLIGVGSSDPFPMTKGNWTDRPDQYVGNCDKSQSAQNQDFDKYPPKYQTLGSNELKENFESQQNCIKSANITMYVMDNCPACNMTKDILHSNGVSDMIDYKDAKENMEYLKSQGASAVPFFICSSGKSEGAVKDLDDLIQKLNLKPESPAESPDPESPAPELPTESPVPESSEQKETYLKNLNIVGQESKNNGTSEPSDEPSGTSEPSDEPSGTSEPSGTPEPSDGPSKSIIITKVYTNPFKTHVLNQQPKKSGKGYYTYENYLPNSVPYDSLAGQLSPAPCGNKL